MLVFSFFFVTFRCAISRRRLVGFILELWSYRKERLMHITKSILVGMVCGWLVGGALAEAEEAKVGGVPILTSDKIQRGMRGIGKTVFEGTKIEEFDVEILGVLKNYLGPRMDLIVGRLSGPPGGALARAAQVIAGMSGSPVYIDGKLIGAVARMWPFEKEPIAGITPIQSMLDVLDRGLERPVEPGSARGLSEWGAGILIPDEMARMNPHVEGLQGATLYPIQTPLILSGFSPAVVQEMIPALTPLGLIPVQGGGEATEAMEGPFEPGAAVGVQLMRGDLSATGIGTLTYREGDRVAAFGHYMMSMGTTDLPMTGAYIYDILPSTLYSSKLGSPTRLLGAIRQDRMAAVAGVLNDIPDMVPVTLHIQSKTYKEGYRFEVVRDRYIGPVFLFYGLINAIEVAEKLYGDATVRVNANALIADHPPLAWGNVYSSVSALAQSAVLLYTPIRLLVQNTFEPVRLEQVSFEIQVEEHIKAALIEEVRVDQQIVKPGDRLQITTFLRPYRGERFSVKTTLSLPKGLQDGPLMLRVANASTSEQWEVERAPGRYRPESLEQLMDILRYQEPNDHLMVELFALKEGVTVGGREFSALPPSALEVLRSSRQTAVGGPVSGVVLLRKRLKTDYVLSGAHVIELLVRQMGL